jgi:flavodoxin
MKTLVVYDSAFGNTTAIARAIGDSLPGDVQHVRDADPRNARGVDLLVVGSPTHGGQPTPAIVAYLKAIEGGALNQVQVAAFDTRIPATERAFLLRMLMRAIGYAGPKIAKALRTKGGKLVAPAEGFLVDGKEGPLRPGEVERASAWLRQCIEVA